LRKDAGAFDLPIALGLLTATKQLTPDQLDDSASVGELALDGSVRPVRGALSMAMEARARGVKRLIVPTENAREAAVVREVEVYGVASLAEAVGGRGGRRRRAGVAGDGRDRGAAQQVRRGLRRGARPGVRQAP
jgi:magnesium chelatase family protein